MNSSELSIFFKNLEQAEITDHYLFEVTQSFTNLQYQLLENTQALNQQNEKIVHLETKITTQYQTILDLLQPKEKKQGKTQEKNQNYSSEIEILKQELLEQSKQVANKKENNGVWIDFATGLMWSRICLGQTWENQQCSGRAKKLSWSQANKLCKEFNLENFNDWRLPTKKELQSLFKMSQAGTLQNALFLPQKNIDWSFWSITPYSSYLKEYVYIIDLENHTITHQTKTYHKHLVRLVRNIT